MIRATHGYVVKLEFELEVPVLTALGYYSMFDIRIAWKLFDQILYKYGVLSSAMVSACVKNDKYGEAIHYFRRMWNYGIEANHATVVSVLPSCAYLGLLCFVKEIQGFLIRRMFHSFTNVQNSLMDAYAKCGELEVSISLFNAIWEKDLISWRIMIHLCIERECPRNRLDIFLKMLNSGKEPDENIIRDTILSSFHAEELKFGLGFHAYIEKNGFLTFVSVGTALLQMYGKFSEFGSAWMVFDQLDYKDVIAWTAMISVFAQGGQPHDALRAFRKIQSINEKPNDVTFVSLVQACSTVSALTARGKHPCFCDKSWLLIQCCLTSALIDLYCKLGRIKEGKAIFKEISNKDLICWSSMINGYGLNGCGLEALETFSNMLNCGVKPNDTVSLSVFSACSQCGLEHEGCKWFCSMQEKYGVTPKLAHYACMVDLLSRRGNIEEIPMLPYKRIWGALLSGCQLRHDGSIEVAEFVV